MTPAGDLAVDDAVVADLVARVAAPSYARWQEQVRRVGYCARPVRLAGQVRAVDPASGWERLTYSTAAEPDGCLLKACGQRRETVCPSCSAVYQSDAFQLLAAGLRGGKGVPESVAEHPALFVTFTAPSFGPVHARRERDGKVERCHPRLDARSRAWRTSTPGASPATCGPWRRRQGGWEPTRTSPPSPSEAARSPGNVTPES